MKIEIFKHKKSFRKGGFHTNPDIGWEIVVYFASTFVIASIIFGFYLFLKINKEFSLSDLENTEQTKIISETRVEKSLEYFSNREQKSNQIISSPSPVVDPSL